MRSGIPSRKGAVDDRGSRRRHETVAHFGHPRIVSGLCDPGHETENTMRCRRHTSEGPTVGPKVRPALCLAAKRRAPSPSDTRKPKGVGPLGEEEGWCTQRRAWERLRP